MRKYYITILCGLFIALQVVLGRWLAIDVVFMRISFVFVPIALGGAILGPLWNGLICVAADIAGFVLFPGQGAFFPGFTLSAFLTGYTYGFFLKTPLPPLDNMISTVFPGAGNAGQLSVPDPANPLSSTRSLIVRTFIASFCINILIDALLNTLWISILYERAYMFYFGTRMIKSVAMLPVHVVVFGIIWRSLGKYIGTSVSPKIAAK